MNSQVSADGMSMMGSRYREGVNIGPIRLFGKQIIGIETPYLSRYILFRCPAFGIYLHRFHRSDYERALHDHPWPFVSIILSGGYWEVHDQTIDGMQIKEWRRRWSVLLRPAEWRHRVVLEPSVGTVWTLMLVGRRSRTWGFFLPSGWCWWRQHNQELGICEDRIVWEGGKD